MIYLAVTRFVYLQERIKWQDQMARSNGRYMVSIWSVTIFVFRSGVDVNAQDVFGRTALHVAAKRDYRDMVSFNSFLSYCQYYWLVHTS